MGTLFSSRLIRLTVLIVSFLTTLGLELIRPEFLTRLDEGLRDTFLRTTAESTREDRITVVDLSEISLNEIGPWPWPRERIADLTEILLDTYGARAVGLDIVFPEAADVLGDARMASLAANAPLALSQIFDYALRYPFIQLGTLSGGQPVRGFQDTHSSVPANGYIANHAALSGARCTGGIGYQPDADGVLRQMPASTRFEARLYPNLATALLACANPPLRVIHGTATGLWRVPYKKSLAAYTVISASDILHQKAPKALVQGRYVLVGSSALGLSDRVSTPLAPLSAGVMVHAASVSGLLDLAAGHARAPWSGRAWLLAWSALSLAGAMWCIVFLPAWGSSLVLVGLVPLWLGQAFAGVAQQAEWSVTAPIWAYVLLLTVAVPYEWWQTQRKGRRLLTTLSHYVAEPVLKEIIRRDLQHSLKPALCDITVLIADMEGYTRATASLSLDDAAKLTKDFLACLTHPVLAAGGTLDKYTGDGLVAFWGAPLPCSDHADQAVSAALGILAEVQVFNLQRRQNGFSPLRVRIGIESGMALVGDLGTSFRSTYTAVGDCINFASRLETAARHLSVDLVIGTVAKTKLQRHDAISLNSLTLRGTQTAIEIFTVLPTTYKHGHLPIATSKQTTQ